MTARVDPRLLPLAEFEPRSRLVVPETALDRPRYEAVDAHNHLGRWLTDDWCVSDVGALIELLDEVDISTIVNLDGRFGAELEANLDRYDRAHPARFATFCHAEFELARTMHNRHPAACAHQGLRPMHLLQGRP